MKNILRIIIPSVIIFFAFVYYREGLLPVNPNNKTPIIFVVERGTPVQQIVKKLRREDLIRNEIVFFAFIKIEKIDQKLQAGDFRLNQSMSASEVAETLTKGSLDIWVTVIEGLRKEEVAEILNKKIGVSELDFLAKAREGYLYPDTYLIPREASASQIISIFENNFNKKIQELGIANNENLNEIIIKASLIEREALTDQEKPLVASVIENRLRQGMALDIDATLQYAKGKIGDKWWNIPYAIDKTIKSPFNTYRNPGLPPAPIASPGFEAIKAAAFPSQSSYFFYLHAPNGKIYFAKTAEEHNLNIEKYLRN